MLLKSRTLSDSFPVRLVTANQPVTIDLCPRSDNAFGDDRDTGHLPVVDDLAEYQEGPHDREPQPRRFSPKKLATGLALKFSIAT